MPEQVAFKTILKAGSTVIGNLVSVEVGGVKVEFKDTTNHGLTDPFRTRRPVMADAQPIKAKVQMTSANYSTLFTLIDPTAAATSWTVTYPYATPLIFTASGWLSDFSIASAEVDGILEVDIEIMPSGKPTFGTS